METTTSISLLTASSKVIDGSTGASVTAGDSATGTAGSWTNAAIGFREGLIVRVRVISKGKFISFSGHVPL